MLKKVSACVSRFNFLTSPIFTNVKFLQNVQYQHSGSDKISYTFRFDGDNWRTMDATHGPGLHSIYTSHVICMSATTNMTTMRNNEAASHDLNVCRICTYVTDSSQKYNII
jgi:hypothetical protein